VFKLVIGQQDLSNAGRRRGCCCCCCGADLRRRLVTAAKQTSMLSARAVPVRPSPARCFDALMSGYTLLIKRAGCFAMLGMAVFA